MRRHDKKIHMERVNKLFEARKLKESAFNWNGKYENEEELEEGMLSLGDDIEDVDEEVTNITTDVESSQFFSDEDGERNTDSPSVG
jgi:hypothetical protein